MRPKGILQAARRCKPIWASGRGRPLPAGSRGGVSIEATAVSVFAIGLVLVAVQACLIAFGAVASQHAARAGADALGRGADPVLAVHAALPSGWAGDAEVRQRGAAIEVTLPIPALVPGIFTTEVTGYAGSIPELGWGESASGR